MHRSVFLGSAFLTATLALPISTFAADDTLEEVVVTSSLRPQSLLTLPTSATVLDSQTLKDAGQQHFQDVMSMVPNLHWAGGTSRPRFFQIRGIGEREQYEGAPNPSVGFLIDDIDFSGLGMPATLFDVSQIEVLRGPQGTRYGANALAGLISVRSRDPEQEAHYSAEATVGDYGTRSLGVLATAPVESLHSGWRVSLQKYVSDGFMNNPYLHRDDTNNRDELTGRFKWRWNPDDDNAVDFTWLHANINNGYDAWTIDNSRNSLSDKPGQDAQRTNGVALKWTHALRADLQLITLATAADSASVHAYDGDWGNAQSWSPFVYDYIYRAERNRSTRSLDVRLTEGTGKESLNWLVGVYALNLRERISEVSQGVYEGDLTDDRTQSRYNATAAAAYGQLEGTFASRWHWTAGTRFEQRKATYHDAHSALGSPPPDLSTNARDTMWGLNSSVSYDITSSTNGYLLLSRGYKAGGFNLGFASEAQPRFEPESLWNLELGSKGLLWSGRLQYDVAVFHQQRRKMQVLDSKQLDPKDPNSFVFYTTNATEGRSNGVELSLRSRLNRSLEIGGALGLVHTEVSSYVQADGKLVPARAQDNAPSYTASLFAVWRNAQGWMARVDFSRTASYYYSAAPSTNKSAPYSLTNVKAGYEASRWQAYGWVRNVFDKQYVIRAFEFGNVPPDFNNAVYTQFGDPRQVGITASMSF